MTTKRTKATRWPHDSAYSTEVVGESFHAASISKIVSVNQYNETKLYCEAILTPNPANQHDQFAVEVHIEGNLVGHLAREVAQCYHAIWAPEVAPKTVCNALVISRLIDSERVYSVWLAINLALPPTEEKQRARYRNSCSMPLLSPTIFRLSGQVVMAVDGLNPKVVALCSHGAPLDVCPKPDSEDVHLFAPGSIGGSGRVAVVETGTLAAAGYDLDSFEPYVMEIGAHFLLIAAGPPNPSK